MEAGENTISDLNKDSGELKGMAERAAKGGLWLLFLKIIHRGLALIRTIILARILSPEDFGLFGIAVITLNFVDNFSVTGVHAALVQKKENIQSYLDSAWSMQLIRSVVLFFILFFGAVPIAQCFNTSDAISIIRSLAVIQLFIGAESIGTITFQKDMRFDKLFYLRFSSVLCNAVVTIIAAFIFKNVWALVYGAVTGALIRALMSYRLHPYRPKFQIKIEKAKELLKFGKWVFGSSILVFLITEGDDIFVGKILGVTALGLYQMAYHFSNISATEISNLVSQITFPVYSQLQKDYSKLKIAYFRIFQIVSFLAFPISGLTFFLAPDFTILFLGKKWIPMIAAMQALSIWGLLRSIGTTTTQVFYGVGKPSLSTYVKLSQLILIISVIYPFSLYWNILGTSLAIVLATTIPNLWACYAAVKIVRGSQFELAKLFIIPFINTSIVILFLTMLNISPSSFTMFFINFVLGIFSYGVLTYLSKIFFNYDMCDILKRYKEGFIG